MKTITIETLSGPIDVEPIVELGELAIHYKVVSDGEMYAYDENIWRVTHIRTGRYILGDFTDYDMALAAARTIQGRGKDKVDFSKYRPDYIFASEKDRRVAQLFRERYKDYLINIPAEVSDKPF